MNVVSAVILVVLAVIGAASVVSPVNDGDNAEFVLRSAAEELRWGRGRRSCAVCLDCDLDEHTRKICETVCRDYGFLKLMTKEELKGELFG